jgi:biopolymer transport protein ExbD
MAEIQQSSHDKGRGKKPRAKRLAFRLDMTPMVDLAFLLLTFFMLTTTFAKPNVMALSMPAPGDPTPVSLNRAMTIILGKNHQVHYYFGLNAPADKTVPVPTLKTTSFAASGIRQVLLSRQQLTPNTIILIKPSTDSQYKDMVDILDEMNITNQKKYALVKISQDDSNLIQTAAL